MRDKWYIPLCSLSHKDPSRQAQLCSGQAPCSDGDRSGSGVRGSGGRRGDGDGSGGRRGDGGGSGGRRGDGGGEGGRRGEGGRAARACARRGGGCGEGGRRQGRALGGGSRGEGVRATAAAAARAGGGEGVRAATACGRRRRLLLLLPWPLASTPRHRRQPPPPPAPTIAFAATAPVAGDDPILLDVDVGAYGALLPVPCSRSSPARCCCSRCTPDPGHTFYPVSRRRPPHFEPVVVTAEKRAALPLSSPFAETRRRFPASSSHRSARRLGQKSWRCHWLADCNCQCGDWTTSVVGIELVKSHTNTMQGIFACGSISSPHGSCFRPACLAVDDLRLFYKINSITCGAYSWRWCVKKLHMRTNRRQMGTTVRTNAKWLFGGDDRSSSNARLERSESANEDILIFYFQLDLQTRIQYALNIEQFDVAKQLREKLTEIETVIIRQREAKRGSSKTEAQDKAINLLRVRADLQKAVDSENYALAAALRDEIAKLETESLAVSAKALAYQNVKYAFRLGQKVRHKVHGYRAVICGMDHVCCESKSWMETANVENLSKGPNQPFYQVLVDVYADPELLVAYVAEENLAEAEIPEKGRFDHPYIEFLFFGEDTAGDFIPIKQLREKYDQPRYEASGDEDDDDGSTDS